MLLHNDIIFNPISKYKNNRIYIQDNLNYFEDNITGSYNYYSSLIEITYFNYPFLIMEHVAVDEQKILKELKEMILGDYKMTTIFKNIISKNKNNTIRNNILRYDKYGKYLKFNNKNNLESRGDNYSEYYY